MNVVHIGFLTFFIALLPGCFAKDEVSSTQEIESEESLVYNLDDSTTIIRSLIHHNNLLTILEDAKPEDVEILINNFSPAEIAFESEVLNCTLPVILYFYGPDDSDQTTMLAMINDLAQRYENRIKFVIINTATLFKLAEKADIIKTPTIIAVAQRAELDRIEDSITPERVNSLIQSILA